MPGVLARMRGWVTGLFLAGLPMVAMAQDVAPMARTIAAHPKDKPRIVGGDEVAEGKAPWQVEIFSYTTITPTMLAADNLLKAGADNKQYFGSRAAWDVAEDCGGVWLGKDWVLTAGHCLYRVDKKSGGKVFDDYYLKIRRVRVGTQTLVDDQGNTPGEIRAIRFGVLHKDYSHDNATGGHDIALLKLAAPKGPDKHNLKPIALPAQGFSLKRVSAMQVTGWGMTQAQTADQVMVSAADPNSPNHKSEKLKYLNLTKVPPEVCAAETGASLGDLSDSICGVAVPDANGNLQDQCRGDSGGPLTAPIGSGLNKRMILIGLVSWSWGCAQKVTSGAYAGEPMPGVYTSVVANLDWIKATMAWADTQGATLDSHMWRYPPITPAAEASHP